MFQRRIALMVPVAAFAVACSKPPAAPAAPAANDIVLTDYAIAAPATIPASMATFNVSNKGQEGHHAALVRLDSGKTYADFQAAVKSDAKGPPPAWIVWMGGAQAFPGGTSNFTMALPAGTYVWYCLIPGPDNVPHVAKGMSAPMTVTASIAPMTAEPVADINVTASDYKWDISTPPTAGKHVLKFTSAPGQPHEAVLIKLAPGKTGKDFVDWAMKMTGAPPAESVQGIPALQAGFANYQTVDFKAGNYSLICFVPDGTDGAPHAVHGMVQDFTVQ